MTILDVSDDVRMYSAAQLAEIWGCSVRHIYELITAGELETVELGIGRAKKRVPAASALAFMQRRQSRAEPVNNLSGGV